MTHWPPRSVISGITYSVVDVADQRPSSLDEFVGPTKFTIDNGGPYVVCGCGARDAGGVRFYEKDHDGDGRDIRVWCIAGTDSTRFTAEHAAPCGLAPRRSGTAATTHRRAS